MLWAREMKDLAQYHIVAIGNRQEDCVMVSKAVSLTLATAPTCHMWDFWHPWLWR